LTCLPSLLINLLPPTSSHLLSLHDALPIFWGTLYFAFYWRFAPSAWLFLLLPVHFLMGVIHGAIVNWCGHRYGYRNFSIRDRSRSEEHTSELQSLAYLVCRLLLEKKKNLCT